MLDVQDVRCLGCGMFSIWDVWDVRCFLKRLKNNAKIFLKIFYSLSQSIFAFSRDSTDLHLHFLHYLNENA